MSQQLPSTDVFVKRACLLLFTETVAPLLALDPSYFSFYTFFPVYIFNAKTSAGSNARFRQERQWRRLVGVFFSFSQTGRRRGGNCFYTLVTGEVLIFGPPPLSGAVSQLSFHLFRWHHESFTHTFMRTSNTHNNSKYFPQFVAYMWAPPHILCMLEIALLPPRLK